MRHATLVLPKRHPRPDGRPCDDVVRVAAKGMVTAFLVADGATGTGDGWQASGIVADIFGTSVWDDPTPGGTAALLARADASVRGRLSGWADTTAVVVLTDGRGVWGASAGDSQAFVVRGPEREELTARQHRRPRIGSGAVPVPFSASLKGGVLAVATDGLWQQVRLKDALDAVSGGGTPDAIVARLSGLVLDGNRGALPDDLGIAVAVPA